MKTENQENKEAVTEKPKEIRYIGGTTLHDIDSIDIENTKGKNEYDTCIIKIYSKDGYCYELIAFGKPDIGIFVK